MSQLAEAPAIAGVTTAARAARAADEQPLSEKSLSIMPSLDDLKKEFRIKSPTPKAHGEEVPKPEEEDEDQTPEADAEDEDQTPEEEDNLNQEPETDEDEDQAPEAEAPEEPVQKRINQLTAQKGELQRQLDETRQQLARAQSPRSEIEPLAHIDTIAELDTELATAKTVRKLAMANRYGITTTDEKGNEVQYDEEQVTAMLLNAEATIEAAATRREQLASMEADESALLAVAPHLAQSTHAHAAYVEKVMAHQGTEIRRMAASAKMSPRRIAYALALGLNQLSAKPAAATPATRAANQAPRKAPPIPTPRTASRAPVKELQHRAAVNNTQAIARGKPGAVAAALESFLH